MFLNFNIEFCCRLRRSFQFASYPVTTRIDSIQVCFINLAGFKNQLILFFTTEIFVNVEENFETYIHGKTNVVF